MKKYLVFGISVLVALATAGCKKDNEDVNTSSEQSVLVDENRVNTEIDDVTTMQDDVMSNEGLVFGRSAQTNDTSLTYDNCAILTITPKGSNPTGKVVLDFGTGCVGQDGRTRKGKIEWTFTDRLRKPGAVITTRFVDYGVKRIATEEFVMVDNGSTKVTTNQNIQEVSVSNPVLSLRREVNMKIRFSDGQTFTWQGTKVSEWNLGVLGNRWDNTYTVKAGSTYSGTDRQGRAFTAVVDVDIVRKTACARLGIFKPVSGKLTIQHNSRTKTIDYGDGSCDNFVTITINGQTRRVRF